MSNLDIYVGFGNDDSNCTHLVLHIKDTNTRIHLDELADSGELSKALRRYRVANAPKLAWEEVVLEPNPLDTPVDRLFPPRVSHNYSRLLNCLLNAIEKPRGWSSKPRLDAAYAGNLVQRTEAELLKVEGMGVGMLGLLKDVLAHHNLYLGMDVGDWMPPQKVVPPFVDARMKKRLSELDLSTRTMDCLDSMKLEYVYEAAQSTREHLLKTKHFGRKSVNELGEVLGELLGTTKQGSGIFGNLQGGQSWGLELPADHPLFEKE